MLGLTVFSSVYLLNVHPVRLMNAQIKSHNLGCESTENWLLSSAFTVATCYYYGTHPADAHFTVSRRVEG